MRDFFLKIFTDETPGPGMPIFGFWHIFFYILIVGAAITLSILYSKKDERSQKRLLDALAITLVVLYLGDFYVHPLMTGENMLIVDKLPFHICTISCPLIAICRIFPKQTKWLRTSATILGLLGSLFYLTYPNGAIGADTKVFCYRTLQTFIYHGVLLNYGIIALSVEDIKPNFKKIWVDALIIVALILNSLGANAVYATPSHHYDWFFTTGSSFGFSPKIMPFMIFGVFFGSTAVVYLIVYLVNQKREKASN